MININTVLEIILSKREITNDTIELNLIMDFITKDEKKYKYGEILKQQGYDISQVSDPKI